MDAVLRGLNGTLLGLAFDNGSWLDFIPSPMPRRDRIAPDGAGARLHRT